jgi:WD40 repeat protein
MVRLWHGGTGKPVGPPLEHHGRVTAVTISPDGRTILSGSLDATARLWTLPIPWKDDPARVELWVQVLTGMTLDTRLNRSGTIQLLEDRTWHQFRTRLETLGGPPL